MAGHFMRHCNGMMLTYSPKVKLYGALFISGWVDFMKLDKALLMGAAFLTMIAPSAAAAADGKSLYAVNCAACHQAVGQGVPGAFPSLVRNKFVVGDSAQVATVALNGRDDMPAFRDSMTDDELAATLSYIRISWGNNATPISSTTFNGVRTGKIKAVPSKPSQ